MRGPGPEQAVTGIAETRPDIAILIQLTVKASNMDRDVGMIVVHPLDSFRRGDETDELDPWRAPFLQDGGGVGG